MKKRLSLLLITAICIFSFSSIAFAHDTQIVEDPEDILIITSENINYVINAAQNGNKKAIDALMSQDCFNTKKIKQLGKMSVSDLEGTKEYVFKDGSSIVLGISKTPVSRSYTERNHGWYEWRSAGVLIGRYYIWTEVSHPDNNTHYGYLTDHWDEGEGIPQLFEVDTYGTWCVSGNENDYDCTWVLNGRGRCRNVQTGVSTPKYKFEFVEDTADGEPSELTVLYP